MKDSEDEDIDITHLVSNLVVCHKNLAYFAGIELGQPNTETRMGRNSLCACGQLTHHSKRGS